MAESVSVVGSAGLSVDFLRSVPLFAVAGVFFVAGVLVLHFDPHYGPGVFTLWALLIALGFVSAIGGVVSWLLTAEPPPAGASPRTERVTPPARVTPPVPPTRREMPPPAPRRNRGEFGRPEPPARGRSEAPTYSPMPSDFEPAAPHPPEWDEEGAREEDPYPVGDPAELVSVDDALRDLDGIERDLVPRARRPASDPTSNPSP